MITIILAVWIISFLAMLAILGKPIFVRSRFLPFGRFSGMMIFPFIFLRSDRPIYQHTIRHEVIHWVHSVQLFVLIFFLIYVLNWGYNLIRFRFDFEEAYRSIWAERIAYANQHNQLFLPRRFEKIVQDQTGN